MMTVSKLRLISMTGSELYTGNAALVPMAWLEGKATAAQVVRNLGGVLPAPLPASPTPSMSPARICTSTSSISCSADIFVFFPR